MGQPIFFDERRPIKSPCYLTRATMDKKAKKRLEVLRQKLQKTEKLLAAAKQQTDEPDEVANIERQVAELKAEIEKIKNG